MAQSLQLSLEELLGNSSLDYVQQVILPEIERLAGSDELSSQQLDKIARMVKERGALALLPHLRIADHVTKNSLEDDGLLAEVSLPLTDQVTIRNFVKRFSGQEDFVRGVSLQEQAHQALKNTDYADAVPMPTFTDRKKRLMITPLVEGETLRAHLASLDETEKESVLRDVISHYAGVFTELDAAQRSGDLNFPHEEARSFEDYFFKDDKRDYAAFMEVFRRELGDELDAARHSVAHKDLHVGNVIKNGRPVYLDWPSAVANGIREQDTAKLLTKAGISRDLEERLFSHAAQELFSDPLEQEASVRRHHKVRIVDDLLTAKRYLFRADAAPTEDKERLQHMSTVAFNSALRRARRAEALGMVDHSLVEQLDLLPASFAGYTVPVLDDESFVRLSEEHDPHVMMSHENVYSPPLVNMLEERPVQESLESLKKTVRSAQWGRRLGTVARVASVIGLVAAVAGGIWFGLDRKHEKDLKRQSDRHWAENSASWFEQDYRRKFSSAYDTVIRDVADGKFDGFKPDDPIVTKVANEYKLDPALIRRMLDVSRCFAGVETDARSLPSVKHVNLLDPFAVTMRDYRHGGPIKDPVKNLKHGAERLADLLSEHGGNLKEALISFYGPAVKEERRWGTEWYFSGASGMPRPKEKMRFFARRLAYGAIHGTSFASDGGLHTIFLSLPPDSF